MPVRQHFTDELNTMYQDILKMGSLVESALKKAVTALSNKDTELAQNVIDEDKRVDELQLQIEEFCTKLIATEQPVARDLREILTSIKIISDLERIGDHARHLAKRVENVANSPFYETVPRLREMAEHGIQMVHDSLTSFVEQDADRAVEVAKRDSKLNRMHQELYKQVLDIMRQNPDQLQTGMDLMFLNRFLERLGDHVTNMCEWVVYSKKGEHMELKQ
jgi:phosphate transport system protein